MQIWAESGKSALPICNYSQILYQFLTFTQNLKRSQQFKYFLLGGSPALCPNGGEIGCDFAPIPYKHSSFPDIPFGMPDFKLFCFQPLKSMLSLMKKDDSPFFRSESCNEAY